MRRTTFSAAVILALTGGLFFIGAPPASAHQHRPVGPFETTVGWLDEPAYAGFKNGVQFIIERPVGGADDHADEGDDHGHETETRPVENAELQVEVIFGLQDGEEKKEAMALEPAFGAPGEYHATLIPTKPGTYTFHIFGTVGKRDFDEYYTSGEAGANEESEGTYNDIREPRDVQFPVKAPSAPDLDEQVTIAAAAAQDADDAAGTALILAIIGIAVGVLGGIVGMSFGRKSSS